jgi:AraC-like DNA-binding protein
VAPQGRNKGSGNPESPVTRPERIAAQERVKKALELRKAGVTYAVIAEKCGYKTPQHAHKAVTAAIQAIPREEAKEARKFEEDRLDRLMLAYWKKALDGDRDSADYILRVMKRRAAMLGLDAPKQFEDVTPPKGYQTGNAPEDI